MFRDLDSTDKQIKVRLSYLREQIVTECISYGELVELDSLADHIDRSDVLLCEWANIEKEL